MIQRLVIFMLIYSITPYSEAMSDHFGTSLTKIASQDFTHSRRELDYRQDPVSEQAMNDSGDWHPYPMYGGEMTSIAIDPNDNQIVFVGTRDAGVFKTTDGAQSWQAARSGLTYYPIRSLAVDPDNSTILYAGTDYDGIWKSIDAGVSWFKSSSGLDDGLIVFSIVIDPQTTSTLYAGLAGGTGLSIGNIYKSTDAGASWNVSDNGIPRYGSGTYTNGIFTMVIDPDDSNLIFAGTNFHGAYVSSDAGLSWSDISDGIPGSPDFLDTVNALSIDPHNQNRLSGIILGTFYIYDNMVWQQVSSPFINGMLFKDYLYFHPTDPSVIFSAGDSFSKSTDSGLTWTQYLGWSGSSNISNIVFQTSSPDIMYAAADILFEYQGGVYKSVNQGLNWTMSRNGITAIVVRSVVIDPNDSNIVYVGEGNGHFYRTFDGGNTWLQDYVGSSEIKDIAIDPLNTQRIFIASHSLYTSTDQGNTFTLIPGVEWAGCIAIPHNASNPIYVGSDFVGYGIYKSSDSGATWIQKNNGLPEFGGDICPILSLEIDPNNPSTLWAGTQYGGGIVKSSNGGDSWSVKGLTDENFVQAIAINPDNSNEILAGAGFYDGRIYKTTDGGTNWQVVIDGIAMVYDLEIDPLNSQVVYAATEGYGVLCSTDFGDTWFSLNNGLFYPVVYSIATALDTSGLLVAGTYGSGLYRFQGLNIVPTMNIFFIGLLLFCISFFLYISPHTSRLFNNKK